MNRLPEFSNEFNEIQVSSDLSINLKDGNQTRDGLTQFVKTKLQPEEASVFRKELKERTKYLNYVAKDINSFKKRIYKDEDHFQKLETKKNSQIAQLQKVNTKLQEPNLKSAKRDELNESKQKLEKSITQIEKGQSQLKKSIAFLKASIFTFKKTWEKETNENLRNLSHGITRLSKDEKVAKAQLKPFTSLREAQRKITKNLEDIGPKMEDWDSKQVNARLKQLKGRYEEVASLNVYIQVFGKGQYTQAEMDKANQASIKKLLEIQKEVEGIISSNPSLSIQSKIPAFSQKLQGLIKELQYSQSKQAPEKLKLKPTSKAAHGHVAVLLEGIRENIKNNMPSRIRSLLGSKTFTPKQLEELGKEKEALREILRETTLSDKNRKTAQLLFETIYEILPDNFEIELDSLPESEIDASSLQLNSYSRRVGELTTLVAEVKDYAAALRTEGKIAEAEKIEELTRPPLFPAHLPTSMDSNRTKDYQNILKKLHEIASALPTLEYKDRENIQGLLAKSSVRESESAKRGTFEHLDDLLDEFKQT